MPRRATRSGISGLAFCPAAIAHCWPHRGRMASRSGTGRNAPWSGHSPRTYLRARIRRAISVAFSRDGRRIASGGGSDGQIMGPRHWQGAPGRSTATRGTSWAWRSAPMARSSPRWARTGASGSGRWRPAASWPSSTATRPRVRGGVPPRRPADPLRGLRRRGQGLGRPAKPAGHLPRAVRVGHRCRVQSRRPPRRHGVGIWRMYLGAEDRQRTREN